MKNFYCTVMLLTAISFAAGAQTKNMEMKKNFNFMHRMHHQPISTGAAQRFRIKINPYWEDVNAPHTYNSYIPQIKVPDYRSVWGLVEYDSVEIGKTFLHTANEGKTWLLDTVEAPVTYGIGTIDATDANTCYASMNNDVRGLGGGIFKTSDGGFHWRQLAKGKIFDSTSFPDFVYFFDAGKGLAVGDNNGDTSILEIYTTSDAGTTWMRVPKENLPATVGSAYSFSFNVYATFENRIWFLSYDDFGNLYFNRSDDFGHHWKLFPYTLGTPIDAFAFSDKLNGVGVSFDDNGVVHQIITHDGGETWTDKSFTGYPMGGFITVIPGTHTFVSTLPSGFTPVYGSSYSNDYGTTWKLIDSGENALHSAVQFLNPFIGWTGAAGVPTSSGGVYKWKLHVSLEAGTGAAGTHDDLSYSSVSKIGSGNVKIMGLYPNPATDAVKINGLSTSARTTLLLFTASGKLLQQSTTTGESYTYSLQNLAAGSYYIKVQSGEKTTTLQFVKK